MRKKFIKAKRNAQRKSKKLFNQVLFFFKMMMLVIISFVFIIILVTKPTFITNTVNFTNESVTSHAMSGNIEKDFIAQMTPHAQKAQDLYDVRPSLLIAQAALESSWGESGLSQESNNYFGIKGSNNGREYQTNEYSGSEWIEINASFKQYNSMEDSVLDYAYLLVNGTSWSPSLYHGAIHAENYADAAYAVQQAGYATDPNYAEKVIQIIEQYHLYELDDN